MKETVIQIFTLLIMMCIILTIILFRWENEIRQTFLEKSPSNALGRQRNSLRDSLANLERNTTSRTNCKSPNSKDCDPNDSHIEHQQPSLNVLKRSSSDKRYRNIKKFGNNSQMNLFALSLNHWGQDVYNGNDGQNSDTGHKMDAINGTGSKLGPKPNTTAGVSTGSIKGLNFNNHSKFNEDVKMLGKRYLVYDCSKSHKEHCGGWSDRLSGILSTFVLASLTNRTFKINFDTPCVLSEYLQPNIYNWTIGHSEFKNKSSSYHVLSNSLFHKMGKDLTSEGLRKYFQADVCFVRMNWDLTRQFRKYPNIQKYVSWITELHFSDIYFKLFDTLFKPSPEIVKDLDTIRKNTSRSKTACAHLRIGGNPSMRNDHPRIDKNALKTIWSFLDQFDSNIYNIFVATDDETVRKTARERYKNTFIDIQGSIMHIDQSSYRQGDVCEGFKKQLLDFLFLTKCDVLVLSNSGFGMMAAYLRTHTSGLHCWTDTGVVPCSRYTVHDFYPLPILAPE
ncbi:uncharacterized protein LOC117337075 [Pecten maximus]|uniref:uncharacterized protein LOC117337075 n=1 Tax=Pecten maximus TaxID=6579 RepID=UPI0014589AE4|nr:uncharacterized protein LOC117337075 [Pecten maximus]